jgi:transposase
MNRKLIDKRRARQRMKNAIVGDVKQGYSASASARKHRVCEGTLRQWQFHDKQFSARFKSARQQGIRYLKTFLLTGLQAGIMLKDAAQAVGTSTSTIQNWRKKDPKFHAAVRAALGK